MNERRVLRKRRNLPHWTLEGSLYFVTFRILHGCLAPEERAIVLEHLRAGDNKYYVLVAAIIMPDHVHLLIRPIPPYDLSRVRKGIKGVSARKINLYRQSTGIIWQDESWGRIVRDAAEFDQQLDYMAYNPVKAGLVSRIEDYPYW